MTQYNTFSVKLSNSELNKLKSGIKNNTEVTLNISPNLIGNSDDETNFPHKFLLTDTEFSKIRKAFANSLWANTTFSKTQLSKLIQSGIFYIFNLVNPAEVEYKVPNKANSLSNKVSLDKVRKTADTSRKNFSRF